MNQFKLIERVILKQVTSKTYLVEADSEEEAIAKVAEGKLINSTVVFKDESSSGPKLLEG